MRAVHDWLFNDIEELFSDHNVQIYSDDVGGSAAPQFVFVFDDPQTAAIFKLGKYGRLLKIFEQKNFTHPPRIASRND